jgi:hypothetical protein
MLVARASTHIGFFVDYTELVSLIFVKSLDTDMALVIISKVSKLMSCLFMFPLSKIDPG